MEDIELGCLGIGEQDTDYVLCKGDSDLLPTLYLQDTLIYEYNQNAWTWSHVSCTIFAAIGMMSDLKNYKFSEAEIKEIDELSYTRGRVRGQGWYVQSAVKLVNDWWNSNEELVKKYGKSAYYRISKYDDDIIEDAIGKLYTIDGNYCPTTKYAQDLFDNGMIDGTDFGTNTNGHSVDVRNVEEQRSVKDSYYGRKYNIYGLKHKLSEITNYGPYFYIYTNVAEDNLEEIKRLNSIKSECNVAIESLGKIWKLVNDTKLRNTLHSTANSLRAKIEDCNRELKKYV